MIKIGDKIYTLYITRKDIEFKEHIVTHKESSFYTNENRTIYVRDEDLFNFEEDIIVNNVLMYIHERDLKEFNIKYKYVVDAHIRQLKNNYEKFLKQYNDLEEKLK